MSTAPNSDVATGAAVGDNGSMAPPSPDDTAPAGAHNTTAGLDVAALANAVLYAPLGLALEARTLMPRFVERGRNQVAMAKMIGQFAVRKGSEDVAAGLIGGQERVLGLLATFGLGNPRPDDPGATGPHTGDRSHTEGAEPSNQAPPVRPEPGRATPEAMQGAAGIDPGDLPIDDYDLLSASQVVPRLDSLTTDELQLIGRYEAGTRARRTILAKVAQLEGRAGGQT